MRQLISIIKNISPFNNLDEMATPVYILKKLLAFFMIYFVAAIFGEAIIIGVLYASGYDPLHGIMPTGHLGILLPYYGFLIFLLVAIFYCRFIENRTLQSMGFNKSIVDYLYGTLIAIFMQIFVIGTCCVILSLLTLCRSNIWISCGLHGIWNFFLYGVLGLTLSGEDTNIPGALLFNVDSLNAFIGGKYGIEASIITTIVLSLALIILIRYWRKHRNGI